jgi:hypothetical protein
LEVLAAIQLEKQPATIATSRRTENISQIIGNALGYLAAKV